jgi:hypothetical protein
MDFLEWLKSMLQPAPLEERVNAAYVNPNVTQAKPIKENTSSLAGVPSWLDSLYKSPLADSLYQISAPRAGYGKSSVPNSLGVLVNPTEGLGGSYNTKSDELLLHSDPKKSGAKTFKHEMGHRFASNSEKDVSGGAYDYPSYLSTNSNRDGKLKTDAILKVDAYGAQSSSEAYAQAFRNAFNFLAETARDPKMDYRKFAGDLEGNTPGMGMIIQDLMKLPIFAKHPLQGQIFTEVKKK